MVQGLCKWMQHWWPFRVCVCVCLASLCLIRIWTFFPGRHVCHKSTGTHLCPSLPFDWLSCILWKGFLSLFLSSSLLFYFLCVLVALVSQWNDESLGLLPKINQTDGFDLVVHSSLVVTWCVFVSSVCKEHKSSHQARQLISSQALPHLPCQLVWKNFKYFVFFIDSSVCVEAKQHPASVDYDCARLTMVRGWKERAKRRRTPTN